MLHAFLTIALASLALSARGALPIYGIHDHDPNPQTYLNLIAPAGPGWVTATVAVGHDPANVSGADFSALANGGHNVICRINNGYFPQGTIPLTNQYDNFARRCSNFVANSKGCSIWVIANETNLSGEWPSDGARFRYVSPADYARCFRKVYNAIKAVRPNDKVLPQALAPWAGPYGAGTLNGLPRDGNPLSWVQYMREMLSHIQNSGPVDGIALHINSRGYSYADIHSTFRRTINGQSLSWSFDVHKDWVDLGIPRSLYHLPLYATECNGYFFWKGGHPEDASKHYEPGWMQEIYAQINRYNQQAAATGKPVYACVNMYRWCAGCDGWNIDGSSNPYRSLMFSDLSAAVTNRYFKPITPVPNILVPAASLWKYRDNGADLGSAWVQPNFNDSAWTQGPAPLGYGDGDEATVISGGPEGNRHITTYFRHSFVVSEASTYTNLQLSVVRDDGIVVYLNGREVFRNNMPAGPPDYRTPASAAIGGSDEFSFITASISRTNLINGTNLLAVEVHQSGGTSSDLSFNLELLGFRNQPPRINIQHDSNGAVIQADDEDGTISALRIEINGTTISSSATNRLRVSFSLSPGRHHLAAIATDNLNLSATNSYFFDLPQLLVEPASNWKFLDNGSYPGNNWITLAFNDASWRNGQSQFGYGDGDERTVINSGPSTSKYITTYFRKKFVISSNHFASVQARLLCDDGAVVYLNGSEIWRYNMPGGLITSTTRAASTIGGEMEDAFLTTNLPPALLRPGTNIAAVEVHQVNPTSSDLSFDFSLQATLAPEPPSLTASILTNRLQLQWNTRFGFRLESSTNLIDWTQVTTTSPPPNGQNSLQLLPFKSPLFYRLRY